MRGKADLFGEIHEDELIKIAWEAALKRGYAIYADYNEYMTQLICQGRLRPTDGGRFQFKIKGTLKVADWICSPRHPETRFYPPGTESPNLGSKYEATP